MIRRTTIDKSGVCRYGVGHPHPCSGMSVNGGLYPWYTAVVYKHGIQEVNHDNGERAV
jgi:hypothetical protein